MEAREASLTIRAAWLYYIHGLTQAQVADHLAMSRVKVHRLIARAHEQHWVKVFVEGSTAEGIALEDALKQRLRSSVLCRGAVGRRRRAGGRDARFRSVGAAGALYLHQYLEQHAKCSIGVGHGRTLAAVADALPKLSRPKAQFVSILGSLTRRSTANPFDVIYRFAEADRRRRLLRARAVLRRLGRRRRGPARPARGAERARSRAQDRSRAHRHRQPENTPAIYEPERKALAALGIVGEVLGQFLDRDGRGALATWRQRAILSLRLDDLRGRTVMVSPRTRQGLAIRATLRSGLLSGLITDETTARALIDHHGRRPSLARRGGRNDERLNPVIDSGLDIAHNFHIIGIMVSISAIRAAVATDNARVVTSLAALAQETRLAIFRLAIRN